MAFTPRLSKPTGKNPYYIRKVDGGYSPCIAGKPKDSVLTALANCVGYAAGRFNEIIGAGEFKYFQYPPNAEDFYDTAIASGLKVGSEPKLGAIAVWAKGKTWTSSDGAGHVAVVEKISADGSIVTSESGYGCANPFWTSHRYKELGNWGQSTSYRFLGFIYQPDDVLPDALIKKGDSGEAVTWLQTKLAEHGYLRKSEIDGDFGRITLGAVLAFQFENGLDVDGLCGDATKAKL